MMILAAAVVLGVLGCSHRATITRADGEAVDGVIVGSDAEQIYVDVDATGPRGYTRRPGVIGIPRDRIREIDHPGGSHAAGGVAVIAGGALAMAIGWGVVYFDGPRHYGLPGAGPEGASAPMLIGAGLVALGARALAGSRDVEMRSRRAAHFGDGPGAASAPARAPVSVQVSMKSLVFDLELRSGLGGGVGVGVPLDDVWRIEPAFEVDAHTVRGYAIFRAPVRVGVSLAIFDGYRLDVMPEVGWAMSVSTGDDGEPGELDPQQGVSMGVMLGHRFRVEEGFEVEVAHGLCLTTFTGEPARPTETTALPQGHFDALIVRLGGRFAL